MDRYYSKTLFFSTLVLFIVAHAQPQAPTQLSFRCTTIGANCNALVGYIPPNATTLSAITTLFNVTHLRSLLGANDLPLSTPSTFRVRANTTIKIPFSCSCNSNATGIPNRPPIYTILPDDGLDHIARNIFAGLVTFQQIQEFNGIANPNIILAGQPLRIPLPCSCDEVDGNQVVHYGHIVAAGTFLPEIAQQFNTSQDTLQRLNNLTDPQALLAGSVLDVPLTACPSMVRNDSRDFPLLVSSGTYTFTARNCVTCKCNTSISSRLQCERSQINSQINSTFCSQIRPCELGGNAGTLNFGNSTTSGCNRTTCAYAGFTNQIILTTLDTESTCPASLPPAASSPSAAISLRGNDIPVGIVIHVLLLCAVFFFSSGHT